MERVAGFATTTTAHQATTARHVIHVVEIVACQTAIVVVGAAIVRLFEVGRIGEEVTQARQLTARLGQLGVELKCRQSQIVLEKHGRDLIERDFDALAALASLAVCCRIARREIRQRGEVRE